MNSQVCPRGSICINNYNAIGILVVAVIVIYIFNKNISRLFSTKNHIINSKQFSRNQIEALLESSLNFLNVNKNFKDHGIDIRNASIDINLMHERKDKIVSSLTKGVSGLFKLNKIDTIEGEAFVSDLSNINIKSRD